MAVSANALPELLASCRLQAQGGYYRLAFRCMGTENHILFVARTPARAEAFRLEALQWLATFEATYSVFRPDSLVCRINREARAGWVPVDGQTEQIFALCDWLYWKTRGVLDPTMGPLIALWDWRAVQPRVPGADEVAAALARVGWMKLERGARGVRFAEPGMQLDLGGVGKEYAVDRVIQLAAQHNITDILVDLGRDIRVSGHPPEGGPWRLGLEHPGEPGRCWGGLALDNQALCCSGNYQRFFKIDGDVYSHILDPRNGRPVNNGCRAVWVVAPTATEAGALSTAALILGAVDGMAMIEETYLAAGCIWCGDTLHQSPRFVHQRVTTERVQVSGTDGGAG